MKRGERWVSENHDVELRGVRRLLRVWLMELVDLVLAKEEGKQIVYYGFPSIRQRNCTAPTPRPYYVIL